MEFDEPVSCNRFQKIILHHISNAHILECLAHHIYILPCEPTEGLYVGVTEECNWNPHWSHNDYDFSVVYKISIFISLDIYFTNAIRSLTFYTYRIYPHKEEKIYDYHVHTEII